MILYSHVKQQYDFQPNRQTGEGIVSGVDWNNRDMKVSVTPGEKVILDLIRARGEATRGDLVASLDLSRSKINGCVDALLKKNIICTSRSNEYTGGRRSKILALNGGFGLVAGIEVGATSIDVQLADLYGRTYARCCEPANVHDGPRLILGRICDILEQLVLDHQLEGERIFGIGIGVPGPVDFARGTVVSPPIMPGWDDFPIVQAVNEHFPFANVVVDNDVNVMALGEITKGAGRGVDNLIFIKIGTGIGAGIIVNGQIYRGSSGCAGDVGHICVDKNGPMCHCGNIGCLEAMSAGPAIAERGTRAALDGRSPILARYYQITDGCLRAEEVGAAAREGDPVAIEIIRDSGRMIGDMLATLVNFFNPDMIVIGGGVSNIGDLLLASIRQTVLNRSLPLSTRNLAVLFSAIGEDTGVTGAMTLAIDQAFSIERNSDSVRFEYEAKHAIWS